MKTNLIIFAILLIAITGCKERMETEPIKGTHTLGTEAKYPGVYAALWDNFILSLDYVHENCIYQDNGPGTRMMSDKVSQYLLMIADDTPNASDVTFNYLGHCLDNPASQDIAEITYHKVTHKFYQDGTTTWDEEWLPVESGQSPNGQISPQGSPVK